MNTPFAKKPYTAPKLETYDDIRQVTANTGPKGNPDGGGGAGAGPKTG